MPLVRVRGRSMIPALRPGAFIWATKPDALRRGDIVLVRRNGLFAKRIVGLPGEQIEVRNSRVSINNQPLSEPYVPETAFLEPKPTARCSLSEGDYFVLGDARDDSLDSRAFGPVKREEIAGVVRFNLWPPRRIRPLSLFLAAFIGGASVLAASSRTAGPLIALAIRDDLDLAIGRFDLPHHWIPATDYYHPPQPTAVFSIFGTEGKLGEVSITDNHRASRLGTFAGWSAAINRWNWDTQPQALAIAGSLPPPARLAKPLPLDDPETVAIAADYLKSKGLSVNQPLLTQAFQIDLNGDGTEETLLCAHNDAGAVRDDQPATIYVLALLRVHRANKDILLPLASHVSFKPTHQTMEDHNRFHGEQPFYRYLAFVDLRGDGRQEIALYEAYPYETVADVFTFDGVKAEKVLSATHQFILN